MDNQHYARVMREVGLLKQIYGEGRFKVRAYENLAREIEALTEPLDDILARGEEREIEGVGESLAEDLREIATTGTSGIHTKMLAKFTPGILDLMRIQGLGPKRIKTIWEELGIGDLDALEEAAQAGRIQALGGFGKKTEQNIIQEIERLRQGDSRMPIPRAARIAEDLRDRLAALEGVERVEIAGSMRRGRDTVGDLDLLVASSAEPGPIMQWVRELPETMQVLASGEKKTSVRLAQRIQLDVRVVTPDVFGSALHYFTGSQAHHVRLRTRAKRMGLKISEYGVFRTTPDGEAEELLASATEEEVFAALGLPFIPPELRQGLREIEDAEAGILPRLIELEDVRGDVHLHTTGSDGKGTVREMAEAAKARGYDYIVVTDHSPLVKVAGGLSPEEFRINIDHIREVDASMEGFRVLSGLEVDILKDGGLDMDHDLLAECDWVVGSIHMFQSLDHDAMTARLLRAIDTGLLSCLGHPTGRLLGGRPGYSYDMEAVFDACVAKRVAVEINGSTGRVDFNAELARKAHDHGLRIALSSDAHSTGGLDAMRWAVQQARRAGFTTADVLNAQPAEAMLAAVRFGGA